MVTRHWTLSTAESCTGGAIAASLVQLAGASDYFLGSVVSYSNAMKVNVLGVSEETLKRLGAVSEATVTEMALGAARLTGSTWALAVSGIAGPTGGTKEKPIGTVWCALAGPDRWIKTWCLHLAGSRQQIIALTIQQALEGVYEAVNEVALGLL